MYSLAIIIWLIDWIVHKAWIRSVAVHPSYRCPTIELCVRLHNIRLSDAVTVLGRCASVFPTHICLGGIAQCSACGLVGLVVYVCTYYKHYITISTNGYKHCCCSWTANEARSAADCAIQCALEWSWKSRNRVTIPIQRSPIGKDSLCCSWFRHRKTEITVALYHMVFSYNHFINRDWVYFITSHSGRHKHDMCVTPL
jgi:hypothetical protein